MKVSNETIVTQVYTCEVCGKTDRNRPAIEGCERQHRTKDCKHENYFFTFDTDHDNAPEGITKHCKDCTYTDQVSFNGYDDEILEKVYNLLKGDK